MVFQTKFLEIKKRAFKSELINNSFWALFGNIIGKGLAMAAGIFVARFLGNEIFGEYGMIRNTLMSIAILSTFGLGFTSTKFIAEYKNRNPEYLNKIVQYSNYITLLISSVMAIALFVSATYITDTILEASHLAVPLRLVSIWIVFNAITTTQIGILAGLNAFKGMARVNTIIGIITFLSSFILTYLYQLNGALTALLLSQILNCILNFNLLKKNMPKNIDNNVNNKLLLRKILIFSLPVAIQESLFPLTLWIISLLLIRLTNYGELGVFVAAMQWNALILFVPGILRNVVLSHLSESIGDKKKHDRSMKIILVINFLMTFIPFLIVFIFSDFISSFYGPSFSGLSKVINIAVFTTILSSIYNVYAQAYLSKGKNWLMLRLRLFRDIGIISVAFFLISKSNGKDGAISIVISSLILNFIFLFLVIFFYEIDKKRENKKYKDFNIQIK
jgi:O-antigen/teichoic acid export membrane protein